MGFTNQTAHYELPQYVATDHPKYLTDFNQAMAAIDAGMYENAGSAATADSKADAAQATADANTSSIGTLDTQINGNGSTTFGLAGDVSSLQGSVNTITSLIGNGEPTTTDKTIIGAINEIYADITGGGTDIAASAVSYDNTTSGLTADDVQEAIDAVVAMIPVIPGSGAEVQSDTLTAGQTSKTLTFTEQTIGATTLVDIYTDNYDVAPTAVATTSTTVTLTFAAQASDVVVAVKIQN